MTDRSLTEDNQTITQKDVAKAMFDAYVWWMQQVSASALEAAAGGSHDDCVNAIKRRLQHAEACFKEWANTHE